MAREDLDSNWVTVNSLVTFGSALGSRQTFVSMLGEEGILTGSELRLCWWLTQVYFGDERLGICKEPSVGRRGQFIV